MAGVERYDRKAIRAQLEDQVSRRVLRRIGKTRYQWIREIERAARPAGERPTGAAVSGERRGGKRVEGRYTRVRQGYGFVEVLGRHAEHFPRDILVPAGEEGEALHGDRVAVEITRRDPRRHRVVGRVVAVTEPMHERVIGTLEHAGGRWHLVPESDLLPVVVLIGETMPRREDAGLIAAVRLTRGAGGGRRPAGVLEEVLGAADDPRVQFLGIVFEHGLRLEFPGEVEDEVSQLPADPAPQDCAGREDLRDLPFVTIDGETARDFDDAVCLEARRGGSVLRVAIADVSHYVRPGSALDAEALRRGTSVYFPDRAIPMLPEALSSQLCSLNPDRDRLVQVAELTYDAQGQRLASRFYRGVIRSRARLTYGKVAAVLSQTQTGEIDAWRRELGALVAQLQQMHRLMTQLYRRRVEAGSLDLDLPEALVDLSEEGRSIGVRLFRRNDAHRIIEELMLEANVAVATFLRECNVPFPYRVHEPPDPNDVDELNQLLQVFGMSVQYDGRVRPQDVQRLLAQLEGHALSRVLSRFVLRSLTQARYSTENLGHFGLAFPVYCHFTSPIRRYPDLLVHRQLGHIFDDALAEARAEESALEEESVQSSQRERQAMEAERAMLDLKKAEFMLGHLLEPQAGTVVSVLKFGMFVELDAYPVEGLVRIDDLEDDRYVFLDREQALKGLRSRRRYRLGDRLLVEATNVSLQRRQIDLAVIERLPSTRRGV